MTNRLNIDADLLMADWLRTRSWDIYTKGYDKLVETPEELREAIAPMTVEHFMTLPAARAMPGVLRKALEAG